MSTVLIVEDNEDLRALYGQALHLEGYNAVLASNGQIALDLLADVSLQPCLIVLDLMMPVMDGWEFLKHREVLPAVQSIPLVVCSAAQENLPSGLELIRKPIDLDHLLEVVNSYCDCHKSTDEVD